TVLRDKPTAVLGASPSPSGARSAQADARRVLARAGARVIEREFAVSAAYECFGPDGELNDPDLRAELTAMLHELTVATRPTPRVAA
ncbi:MAG: NAD(P)H-dependent oxidoreductase, partial [Actinomycetota bacterium]|nr:NAD(P)H-dependent oxidoreductase [Actinomycetota bacterium]